MLQVSTSENYAHTVGYKILHTFKSKTHTGDIASKQTSAESIPTLVEQTE